jgi:hypothetical protein
MSTEAKEHNPLQPEVMVDLIQEMGLSVVDRVELPERRACFAPVPPGLALPVRNELERAFASGLYSHQAAGLEAALFGQNAQPILFEQFVQPNLLLVG